MAKVKAEMPEKEAVFISEADQYLFAQGTHYDIYKNWGPTRPERKGRTECSLACGRPMRPASM